MSDILSPQFLRLKQIIGDKERGLPPVIPVCRSTWWQGVKGALPRADQAWFALHGMEGFGHPRPGGKAFQRRGGGP
jgi:hypothetical protein